MLAGRMKLKTFLAIFGLGGTTAVGGGLYATGAFEDKPDRSEEYAEVKAKLAEVRARKSGTTEAPSTVSTPAVGPAESKVAVTTTAPAVPAAPAVATDASRPWDAFLLGRSGQNLGSSKLKDAAKGKAWKVNLYQDDGEAVMNRAKVDFDRDDKWDEKWTFAADGISRKLAPADDENYTQSFTWDGSGWVGP